MDDTISEKVQKNPADFYSVNSEMDLAVWYLCIQIYLVVLKCIVLIYDHGADKFGELCILKMELIGVVF